MLSPVLVHVLYIILLASFALIVAVAGIMWWRVRRLSNCSRTQFMRRVKDPAEETGAHRLSDLQTPPA